MRGRIIRVLETKNFGFLKTEQSRTLFFHKSALHYSLDFDETLIEREVEFDTMKDSTGRLKAVEVRPLHMEVQQ